MRIRSINSKAASWLWVPLLLSAVSLAGCQGVGPMLMPTPNLYAWTTFDPFEKVPAEFQNNYVDVLYLTDRTPEKFPGTNQVYGYKRSRSVGFGVSRVEFGKDVSWADLVKASRTSIRVIPVPLSVAKTTEMVRFPQTPRSLVRMAGPTSEPTESTEPGSHTALLGDIRDDAEREADDAFHKELSNRLAMTPQKEVYLYIHGYNNSFEYAVETLAQLWHFFGRQGVPIAYSWPAGSTGLLRGYTYDSASSEFTVFHLKQMIRLIADCPDVKKINIICHSRGTDTTINALRELHMEIHASGRNTREVLKLGTVVLAAPDIDLDVVIQKFTTVQLGQVPERFAMYICGQDKALGLSAWLFGGLGRLGELQANMFTREELAVMRKNTNQQIIDARVTHIGAFGHDYFHSNPSVSSDLILLMRYHIEAGSEFRPLRVTDNGFWAVDDDYPGPSKDIAAETAGK